MASEQQDSSLQHLPIDAFVCILGHLATDAESLASLGSVNRTLHQLFISSDALWQALTEGLCRVWHVPSAAAMQQLHALPAPEADELGAASTVPSISMRQRICDLTLLLKESTIGHAVSSSAPLPWRLKYKRLRRLVCGPLKYCSSGPPTPDTGGSGPLPMWMSWQHRVRGAWCPACAQMDGIWQVLAHTTWKGVPPGIYSVQFRMQFKHRSCMLGDMNVDARVLGIHTSDGSIKNHEEVPAAAHQPDAFMSSGGYRELCNDMLARAPAVRERPRGWPKDHWEPWWLLKSHIPTYMMQALADESNKGASWRDNSGWVFLKAGLIRVPAQCDITVRLFSTRSCKSGFLLDCASLMPVDDTTLLPPLPVPKCKRSEPDGYVYESEFEDNDEDEDEDDA